MSHLQLDGNKLLHHLDRLNAWDRGDLIAPIYVAFSPTSYCNHSCIFCVYHYKEFKPIFFPLARYQELVHELKSMGVRSLFFAGDGEPLLNKQTPEMIKATHEAGLSVALNTNGRLLNENSIPLLTQSLSFIRISINAGSSENYAKIHGTHEKDFEVVLSNIKNLVEEKRKQNSNITIGTQCVFLNQNKNEIKQLAKKIKDMGANYLAVKPFLKHPDIKFNDHVEDLNNVLIDLNNFSKEISDENFSFTIRSGLFLNRFERKYKSCQSTDFMIEVDALGDVYSCGPYLGNEEHRLGNVMKTSFQEFWESEKAAQVRNHVRCSVDVSKCMPFCRPHSVNEMLWQIKNPPKHVNYI